MNWIGFTIGYGVSMYESLSKITTEHCVFKANSLSFWFSLMGLMIIPIWYSCGWGQGQISNMKVMVNGMVIMSVYKGPVVSEDINLSNNPHINFFQKYRAQYLGEKSTYCERKITVLRLLWYFLFTFINCRWVAIKCNYCKVSNDSTLHQGSSVIMCQKSAACKC